VQGKRLGSTPLRSDDIASGKFTLELRKAGFEPLVRAIELAPGQIFQLDVDLSSRRVEVHSEALTPAAAPAALPSADESPNDSANDEPQARADSRPQRAKGNGSADARRRRSDGDRTPRAEPANDDLAELETDHAAPEGAVPPTAEAATAEPGSANDPPAPADDVSALHAAPAPAPAANVNPARGASEQRPAPTAPAPAAKAASRAPVVIAQTAPRFPARATRMGIAEGSVTLEFTVERSGAVSNARVVQATPPGVFDDAALRAIEKWRYQPKIDAGKPVDSRLRFTFKFRE
jgi:protein TonB